MGSKAFLFLGLCLAIFVMISSEVLARELAETSTISEEDSKKSNNKNEGPYSYGGYPAAGYPAVKYPGNPGPHTASGGGYPDGSRRGRGGGGYCRYGCCGGRNYNGCSRCCSYKGEAIHG